MASDYFTVQKFNKIFHFGIACLFCFATLSATAQDKTKTIGNKPRAGKSNNSFDVVKGAEVGIRMDAGHKPVQLLKLNFDVNNQSHDSIPFKVNVYQMDGKWPGAKAIDTKVVASIPSNYQKGESQLVSVDLSSYNLTAKGDILVAIEWLTDMPGHEPSFSCGLLNGGTYYRKSDGAQWKKIPVVGADFNVLVKKQ